MKPWYESKTLWFNALAIVALVIPNLIEALGKTFPGVELINVWGAFALAVVNIVLRFVTNEPLKK